jgi:Mannosyltransferase (PIG-V)
MEGVLERPASRAGHVRHAAAIVAIFLLSRAALVAIGLATKLWHGQRLQFPGDLVDLFVRWDAGWYLAIAEHGYSTEDHPMQPGANAFAFSPVYPWLVRGVARVTELPSTLAALIVSNCAFLAALFVIFAYGRKIGLSDRAAVFAVALLAVTPGSIVFSAPYTESVFLLVLAGAMLLTLNGRFWAAGLAAALLSAVRPNGFLFAAFPAARLVRQNFHTPSALLARPEALLPIAFAPAGLFAFYWFAYFTTGDPLTPLTTQSEGWGRALDWPWFNAYILLARGGMLGRYWMGSSLLFFAASLLLVKFRYYDEFWFCFCSFVFFWSAATVPNSLLRFVTILFPIYLGLARFLDGRPVEAASTLAALAAWNAALMVAWTLSDVIVT